MSYQFVLSIVFHLAYVTLAIWIGVMLFRTRSLEGWLTMVAAVLGMMLDILLYVGPRKSVFVGLGDLSLGNILSWGRMLATLIFLSGILLHLSSYRSQASRMAELEAIIRDRDA